MELLIVTGWRLSTRLVIRLTPLKDAPRLDRLFSRSPGSVSFAPALGDGISITVTVRWDGCGVDACFAFGTLGDVPVLGDYDGDGKADIAVYRDGYWYILRSSDGGVTCGRLGRDGTGHTGAR